MKKIFNSILFTIMLLVATTIVCAQDYHLSQYDAAPQYLNPALTGGFFNNDYDYRITANYRTQWRSLSRKPYVTGVLGYDTKIKRFGVGGYVINDKAGSLGFNTFNLMASGSYEIINNPDNKHHLLVGAQMGLLQKGYSPNNYVFDSQYSASQGNFDPDLPNNEAINSAVIFRYDASMGIYYKNTDETKRIMPYGGFSVFHIAMPNEAFTSQKTNLPMRFVVNGGAVYPVNKKLSLQPNALYMWQGQASELNVGMQAFYALGDSIAQYSPTLGVNYRYKDAVIIQGGLKHGNNIYRIGYDINVSTLKNYSGGRGAVELSVIYTGKRKKPASASFVD